ncbi:hypothetical protein Nepgr_023013 [Nepenthes gracilis]|uniref:Uncharacterized protein n=1 Tax=Nepenthes gracilis TaxID=150966 RepID=A0AAD3T3K2_NEPGR|nr:hypothetical protein Nepgr_023013 [Nepenthes gracilis]
MDSKQELHPSKSRRLKRRSQLREHAAPTQHPTESICPSTSSNSPRHQRESPPVNRLVHCPPASGISTNEASYSIEPNPTPPAAGQSPNASSTGRQYCISKEICNSRSNRQLLNQDAASIQPISIIS